MMNVTDNVTTRDDIFMCALTCAQRLIDALAINPFYLTLRSSLGHENSWASVDCDVCEESCSLPSMHAERFINDHANCDDEED